MHKHSQPTFRQDSSPAGGTSQTSYVSRLVAHSFGPDYDWPRVRRVCNDSLLCWPTFSREGKRVAHRAFRHLCFQHYICKLSCQWLADSSHHCFGQRSSSPTVHLRRLLKWWDCFPFCMYLVDPYNQCSDKNNKSNKNKNNILLSCLYKTEICHENWGSAKAL